MDNMKTPSSTGVIKFTENSETALEDTETITSGSMITIASTDEKTIQDEQKDQDDQEEQNDKDDQGDQGDQEEHWVHGESPSELHLESVHSSMQSLMIEGTPKFMISMQSGTMITIDDQDDHGDQGDQGDHCVHAPWGPKRPRGPRQKSNIKRSLTIPYPGFERKAKQVHRFPYKGSSTVFYN